MRSAASTSSPLALALALAFAGCGWNDPDYVYDTDTSTGTTTSGTTSGTSTSGAMTAATTMSSTGTASGTSGSGTSGESSGSSEGTGSSTGSSTGSVEDMAICAAAKSIVLLDPTATPVMAPWEPGEVITVGATLHNAGGADFVNYPGIKVSADHPLVTSGQPENWLYAIFGEMMAPLGVTFVADPSIPAGTKVTFTIELVVLGKSCEGLDSVTVTATVM